MAPMPGYFPGMGPIRGYIDPEPEATAEEVHGNPVNPFHGQYGEQAQPYSWQSQLTNYNGHMGPYGPENGLIDDGDGSKGMSAGTVGKDPYADLTPNSAAQRASGHAAPMTRTLSGPLPSQYDAVNQELVQAAEIRSTDLGGSRKYTTTELGDAQQDHWQEVWDVETGTEKYPAGPVVGGGVSLFGFGNNDRTINPLRKINGFGYGSGHHHRRFATGSIPGNYMWLRPAGRPLVKTSAGPARPAIGQDSPFTGDDLSLSYGIQGAVLVNVPQEYQAPPTPQMVQPVNMDEPSPEIPLW